jgi:hypothetical protein
MKRTKPRRNATTTDAAEGGRKDDGPMSDGYLPVVQIACGPTGDGSHALYALTDDGRIWRLGSRGWLDEPQIPDPVFTRMMAARRERDAATSGRKGTDEHDA